MDYKLFLISIILITLILMSYREFMTFKKEIIDNMSHVKKDLISCSEGILDNIHKEMTQHITKIKHISIDNLNQLKKINMINHQPVTKIINNFTETDDSNSENAYKRQYNCQEKYIDNVNDSKFHNSQEQSSMPKKYSKNIFKQKNAFAVISDDPKNIVKLINHHKQSSKKNNSHFTSSPDALKLLGAKYSSSYFEQEKPDIYTKSAFEQDSNFTNKLNIETMKNLYHVPTYSDTFSNIKSSENKLFNLREANIINSKLLNEPNNVGNDKNSYYYASEDSTHSQNKENVSNIDTSATASAVDLSLIHI